MNEKLKLLCVDDEPEILEFLSLVFRDFDCKTALNVESAVGVLNNELFDVLITDMKMPGGGGVNLIDYAHEKWPQLPIIVITGHYQDVPPEIEMKIRGWVLKPFTIPAIRDAVMSARGV